MLARVNLTVGSEFYCSNDKEENAEIGRWYAKTKSLKNCLKQTWNYMKLMKTKKVTIKLKYFQSLVETNHMRKPNQLNTI